MEYNIIEKNKNFDIVEGIEKAVNIYNHTIHITTKIEPFKSFNFTEENYINNVISNTLKSQKFTNKIYFGIDKGEKCLLNECFLKKGNRLKNIFNKKGKYRIPIIINQPLGGTQYSFNVPIDLLEFKSKVTYNADYRLIKRCHIDVWEYFFNEIKNI